MTKILIFDFAKVLLFPKDDQYAGGLNDLHRKLSDQNDYKVTDYFYINDELLNYIKTLKGKFRLMMYTSETIQNEPDYKKVLEPVFETIISATGIGYQKSDPVGYKFISKNCNLNPNEVIFVDDNESNIKAASEAGWGTILYKNNIGVIEKLQSL